jgi:hypothetical protein
MPRFHRRYQNPSRSLRRNGTFFQSLNGKLLEPANPTSRPGQRIQQLGDRMYPAESHPMPHHDPETLGTGPVGLVLLGGGGEIGQL